MKELFIKGLEIFGSAYWIEVNTDSPRCTYYFGPFLNQKEARLAQDGYIEDLKQEGTKGISLRIDRFKPKELTIFNELEELGNGNKFSQVSAIYN